MREAALRSELVERALVDCLFALEHRLGGAPTVIPWLQATREGLLERLSASPNLKIRTEIAMYRQLLLDRGSGGPPMRGPFYEEGELVRHLEDGDARLVARHLELIERSARPAAL